MKDLFIQYGAPVLGTLLAGLLAGLFSYLTAYVRRKVANEAWQSSLVEFLEHLRVGVLHEMETRVGPAKADNRFTPDVAAAAKAAAIEYATKATSDAAKAVLAKNLSPLPLADFAAKNLEATVGAVKAELAGGN